MQVEDRRVVQVAHEKPPLRAVTFTSQTKFVVGDDVSVTSQSIGESGLHIVSPHDCVLSRSPSRQLSARRDAGA
jgi:hypothetical protein